MERASRLKRAACAVATLLALWIAATLPSTVINCSYSHGPYEPGFASWWLLMEFSSLVLLPVAVVAGLFAAFARISPPPRVATWAPVATLVSALFIGAASWLTAHPGQPNCFP